MKTKLLTALLTTLGMSASAFANTYTFDVNVDVNNNIGNLKVSQVSPVKFPTIVVDGSTKAGATCHTNSGGNELCRGVNPNSSNRYYGTYDINGSVLAPVNISLSGPLTVNGLAFTPAFHPSDTSVTSKNHTLSSSGQARDYVYGFLELVDPAEVETKNTTFTFSITAAYN